MNFFSKIEQRMRTFDSVDSYVDGSWQIHQFYSPIPWRGRDYVPDGRFVFHRLQTEVAGIETALIQQIRERKITAFKYAKKELPGEIGPAIVVYAQERERASVRSVLESLAITDLEWREGNPRKSFYQV